MDKLFTVAGFSVNAGERKFRVANGGAVARMQKLARSGHTAIELIDLPRAMTKDEALIFVTREGTAAPVAVAMVEKKSVAKMKDNDLFAARRAAKKEAVTGPGMVIDEKARAAMRKDAEESIFPEGVENFKPLDFLAKSWRS